MTVQWVATYQFRDGDGDSAGLSIPFTSVDLDAIAAPADDPLEFARQLALYIDAITNGAIVSIRLHAVVPLPALQTIPDSLSDVQEMGTFKFRTTNGFLKTLSLPTFDENFIIPGTKNVDKVDVAVADFVEMLIAPINLPGAWTLHPTDARGEHLITLETAIEDFNG